MVWLCVCVRASVWIRFVICKKANRSSFKCNKKYVCSGGYLISETAYAKFLTSPFTITHTRAFARTRAPHMCARCWMEQKETISTVVTFHFQTNERQLMFGCVCERVCLRLLFAHFVPMAYCTISLVHIISISLSLASRYLFLCLSRTVASPRINRT